jgi:signal transduction histidine kinase
LLLSLVDDFIDYSRIHHKKLKINNENNDIQKLIKQTTRMIRFQAEAKGLHLFLNIDENTP